MPVRSISFFGKGTSQMCNKVRWGSIISAVGLMLGGAVAHAQVVGSQHDLTSGGTGQAQTGATDQVCVFCHTPHDSVASTDGPLWNRGSYTPTGFTMYPSGGTIQGTISAAPDGTSVLCLSCHDGTLAIDSFGGTDGGIVGAGTAGNITAIDATAQVDTDEERLAREISYLAEKWDINEEVVRFRSHLELFRAALDGDGSEPVGKRLGFLVQEMLREANTVGSKANDALLAQASVAIKEEIERVREQVENVE